jgi:gliding motility-associated-like protein
MKSPGLLSISCWVAMTLCSAPVSEGRTLRIFSRWGVKIFETNDLRKGWDGTINGQTAPLETYSWVVECFDVNGNKLIRKGMVTLLRY